MYDAIYQTPPYDYLSFTCNAALVKQFSFMAGLFVPVNTPGLQRLFIAKQQGFRQFSRWFVHAGRGYAAAGDFMDNSFRVTHKFHNCLDNASR